MSSHLENLRVLVVDADPILAGGVAIVLQAQGYNVRALYGAEAALAALEDFKPHALICEVVLPGMNGIDLANRVTERLPDCKVLLVSSTESVIEVMEDTIPGGNFTFLRKPLDLFEVLEFLAGSHREP